jgi:hypothetical protein
MDIYLFSQILLDRLLENAIASCGAAGVKTQTL